MRVGGRLIERYIIRAVLPYLLLAFLLLTAILFTQQVSRFSELLFGTRVPLAAVGELAFAVLPSVLIFTLPMALLTGILIGFSRMGSDSELTAMRAAGVGTWRLLWPTLLIGGLITTASLYANLNLLPESARLLRRAGMHAALYKLESPVEPRSFNTDIPGYVVYVRDGDKSQGVWGRVFLYRQMQDGSIIIVTAKSGRIDSAGEQSELVLSDVARMTFQEGKGGDKGDYVTERLDQLRIVLDTGRKTILEALRKEDADQKPSEMSWRALSEYASSRTGTEGREARFLMHKRLAMSLTPLFFAFLGTSLGLRIRRGGRGLGILLSVSAMLAYYLVMLGGEQLARAGTIPPLVGGWLASIAMFLGALILLMSGRRLSVGRARSSLDVLKSEVGTAAVRKAGAERQKPLLPRFPSLMDLNILRTASLSFTLAFVTLTAIFLVFTLFELWRFIVSRGVSMWVVGKYLVFLIPMVSVQILPASVLIALLATYALMSRRSESIAWWASGQSVYRLMLPGFIFAAALAACLWLLQEHVMPQANIRQDDLRAQIRGGGVQAAAVSNRQWLASAESNRLYSYEYEEPGALRNLLIYDLDSQGVHLQRVTKGDFASWGSDLTLTIQNPRVVSFDGNEVRSEEKPLLEIRETVPPEVFKPASNKPAHLSADALSKYIKTARKREASTAGLVTALHKKYANPFGALVMALTGIPLALSFGRRSAIIALCLAIALGLLFWAVSGVFQQMGEYDLLPQIIAAWSPVVIFAAIGIYLLTRSRT